MLEITIIILYNKLKCNDFGSIRRVNLWQKRENVRNAAEQWFVKITVAIKFIVAGIAAAQ